MDTDADLPRSNVRRIVKQKVTELKGTGGSDIHLNRDALTALSEACRVFIHLISATANDICLESKRQTIAVDDVIGESSSHACASETRDPPHATNRLFEGKGVVH